MADGNPIRIGILGAGMIAADPDGFLPNLGPVAGKVEVVAIADAVFHRATEMAATFGIPKAYPSLADLLDDPDVEAVANLTPIGVHARTSLQILQSGRHLISEKPLATTLAEADEIIREADERGLTVVCAPPDALYAQYVEARRLIDAGEIGRIAFARVRSSHSGPGGAPDGWPLDPSWYYTDGSGPLFDMGVYGIHEITALLGPALRVSAFAGRTDDVRRVRGTGPFGGLEMPVTTDDNCLFMLDFGNSTFAVIDATYNVLASKSPKVEVFGRKGALAIYHRDVEPLEVFKQDIVHGADAWVPPAALERATNTREIALHRAMLFEHLADCVRTGSRPVASAEHARHALEVMLAVTESARLGRVIELQTSF